MKNIVLYAPPAAGKGTQCEMLARDYGYNVISIGEVLRNQRNPETEIGRLIIKSQDEGVLTPDDIVVKALENELTKYSDEKIVIEGFPRNINQANLLDSIISDYIVINLDITRDIASKRSLGRLNCNNCGKIYNIYFDESKPKTEGVCDVCGSSLKLRSDDNIESFNKRFDVYESNAPDIIKYYSNKGILNIIDSSLNKDYVSQKIKEIIE